MRAFYALDVGGSHLGCAVVGGGKVLAHRRVDVDFHASLEMLLPVVERELLECAEGLQPAGLAIAFPALTDPVAVTVLSAPTGKFEDAVGFRFDEWSRQRLNVPARIEQDARMSLMGERAVGAVRDCNDAVLMALGTGIGTAAVIEGRLLRGKHFQAGSLGGHFASGTDLEQCICGNLGCTEAYASTWALPRLLRQFDPDRRSELHQGALNYERVFSAARSGDPAAIRIKKHSLGAWGAALVNLIHAYDPDVAVLTGGVLGAGDDVLRPLADYVARHAWTGWGMPEIRRGQLGAHAALLGAEPLWDMTR